ncbi:ABC transporter ATP-binding protein [Candidatus Saccharibacteria bacterium]|nr:ABC transporter ATP-binding protein [Candidatus Saccharibacteria bacterium]
MSINKKALRFMLQEAMVYRKRVIFSIVNSSLTAIVGTFIGPLIISRFIDQLQANADISLNSLWPLIFAYSLTQLYGEMLGHRLTILSAWSFEIQAARNIHHHVYNHLLSQPMKFHSDRFSGSLVSQTNKLTGAFDRFWDTVIFQITPSATAVVATISILAFVFWQYALFIAIVAIIFLIALMRGSRLMARLNLEESRSSTKITGRLADSITNITAIKSHGHEAYEIQQYSKYTKHWHKKSSASMWGFLKVSSAYSGLIVILNTGALCAAVIASSNGAIPISVIYLSVTYTLTVARQLWEVNSIIRNYHRLMGDAYEMTEILHIEPTIKDIEQPEEVKFARGGIEFSNVTFSHEGKDILFDKLNIKIKPGEKIGLVGHSGSGKTTLTKLLLRFNDIDSGTIKIDGQDITQVAQSALRQHIAYVPQEPILFHRTLSENIEYGQLDSTPQTIEGIAKLANAHEFIDKLPDKYKTLVGERGVKLSGGQRQRIAIARAMLKNAPILLLDEATSALDSESEELIQDALWKLMEGRTAIVIAHRLSTIQKMDRILVMNDGKIIEEGTHKELINKKGAYANLWQKQSGGFIEAN